MSTTVLLYISIAFQLFNLSYLINHNPHIISAPTIETPAPSISNEEKAIHKLFLKKGIRQIERYGKYAYALKDAGELEIYYIGTGELFKLDD